MQICRKRERKKFDLDENFTTNKESSRAGIFKEQGTYFFLVKNNKTPNKHSMLGKRDYILAILLVVSKIFMLSI